MRYRNDRKFWKSFRIMRIIAWIAVAAAVALCLFVAVKGTGGSKANSTAAQANPELKLADGQMTQADADARSAQRMQDEALPGIIIDGRKTIKATAGQTVIRDIDLINNADNKDYYLSYELRLPDDSAQGYEVLFRTDLIAAGNTILDIELSRPLEAGRYECVLFAQPYYVSNKAPTNNIEMGVILEVT